MHKTASIDEKSWEENVGWDKIGQYKQMTKPRNVFNIRVDLAVDKKNPFNRIVVSIHVMCHLATLHFV